MDSITEQLFGTVDISTPIDCILGLAAVASVAFVVWALWGYR